MMFPLSYWAGLGLQMIIFRRHRGIDDLIEGKITTSSYSIYIQVETATTPCAQGT